MGEVTFSIDDGTRGDLRVADLLARHGLRGTFYVPVAGPREITPAQMRELDSNFELGSHGSQHIPLTTLSRDAAACDVRDGKRWLEDVLGHQVTSFAYPFGLFNSDIASLVAGEGFACARTCELNRTDVPTDPYRAGITADATSHGRRTQLAHALRGRNFRGLREYVLTYRFERDWETQFRRALQRVRRRGGIAHLVVHSIDVEQHADWSRLDRVLHQAAASTLTPCTNTEAFTRR